MMTLGRKTSFPTTRCSTEYSEWLVAQREEGWTVIDLHTVMKKELAEKQKEDAEFTFQPDAVHPNPAGHQFIAAELIKWFGGDKAKNARQRRAGRQPLASECSCSATLTCLEAGHKRPGVKRGLPIAWAKAQANSLTDQIRRLSN